MRTLSAASAKPPDIPRTDNASKMQQSFLTITLKPASPP
jgi:hypothetical protein